MAERVEEKCFRLGRARVRTVAALTRYRYGRFLSPRDSCFLVPVYTPLTRHTCRTERIRRRANDDRLALFASDHAAHGIAWLDLTMRVPQLACLHRSASCRYGYEAMRKDLRIV
jgi:hypothetical protein